MSRKPLGTICLLVLLLVTACGGSGGGQQQATTPQGAGKQTGASTKTTKKGDPDTLRIALTGELPTLDLPSSVVGLTHWVGIHIWEPLFAFNAKYDPVPMLAKDYKVSPDGLEYTLNLREGVKFHNGAEMTAADVVASIQRWRSVSGRAKKDWADVTAVTAEGNYKVIVKLSKPFGALPASLAITAAMMAVMPKTVIDATAGGELKEYVGTGPYKFGEWQKDRFLRLERFDGYSARTEEPSGLAGKKAALIKTLQFVPLKESGVRSASLESGDVDVVTTLSIDDFGRLKGNSNLQVQIVKPVWWITAFFNTTRPPFNNLKLRQAVQALVDCEEAMVAAAGDKAFYRLDPGIMFQEQVWNSKAGAELYNQKNPQKAKELLQDAGYGGQPVVIMTTKDYDWMYKAALVTKAQMEAAGLKVDLQVYDWPTVVQRRSKKDQWDMLFTGFGVYGDPSQFSQNFASLSNYPGWFQSAEMDRWLDAGRQAVKFEDRQKAYAEVQRVFYAEVPALKYGDLFELRGWRSYVQGVQAFDIPVFWNVSIGG